MAEFGHNLLTVLDDRGHKLRVASHALVQECYRVNKEHFEQCKLYATTEPYFSTILRKRQFPILPSERVTKVKSAKIK